jgi:starch synthase
LTRVECAASDAYDDGCYPKGVGGSCPEKNFSRRGYTPGGPLKVLFVTSEFAPLIKTGGLADVSGSLPLALRGLGVDVRVLLPAYPAVLRALAVDWGDARWLTPVASIAALGAMPAAHLLLARSPQGLDLLLLDCPPMYDRPGNPYLGPDGSDWPDNDLRFGLLSQVAALLGSPDSPLPWRADLVHSNDWQAALAPVYLRHQAYGPGRRAASIVTIHNLAYQGLFPAAALARLALPPATFSLDGVEFFGQVSFLKGGLAYADAITTVSPTYAREICAEPLGFGLQGLLSARAGVLTGILNGVDTAHWDPARDPLIARRYGADTLDHKRANKRALQSALGLEPADDTPVLGVVSRLVEQKGIDLIADVMGAVVESPAQFAIQGTGDRAIEARLLALAEAHPRRVGVRIAFDEKLAHLIEAGADLFLMPSRFEPCGMNQMYSQRYGTLPVVCRTGGLADSVVDCTPQTLAAGTASGFSFEPPSAAAFSAAIGRALALYRQPETWAALQRSAMARDVSWNASAAQYVRVYERVLA